MPTIRVENDVMEGLKKLAEPFVDTPSSVIRRLLERQGVMTPRDPASRQKSPVTATGERPFRATTTPQPFYEEYLLAILERNFHGTGDKRNVTQAVMEKMQADGFIGAADLELVSTGETKAENTVAWSRNALKDRGYISRSSPRGIWELTPEGRAAAKRVQLRKASRS
jgi:hypothetical protein